MWWLRQSRLPFVAAKMLTLTLSCQTQVRPDQCQGQDWFDKPPPGSPSLWREGLSDQVTDFAAMPLPLSRGVKSVLEVPELKTRWASVLCFFCWLVLSVKMCANFVQEVVVHLAAGMISENNTMQAAVRSLKTAGLHFNQLFVMSIPLFKLLASDEKQDLLLAIFEQEYPVSSLTPAVVHCCLKLLSDGCSACLCLLQL